jgi:hypothetical protein
MAMGIVDGILSILRGGLVSFSVNLKGWSLSGPEKGHLCLSMGICRFAVMTVDQG